MSNDIELNLNSYSIITSAYCENVPLAIDDNPETYATFTDDVTGWPSGSISGYYLYNDTFETIRNFTNPNGGTYWPPGTYKIQYISGDMDWNSSGVYWNAAVNITDSVSNTETAFIGTGIGDPSWFYNATGLFQEAHAGVTVNFVHVGGTIGIANPDTYTLDNQPGSSVPTYNLVYFSTETEAPNNRYLHFNFQTDLWITRVGYLGNGVNAAFAFDSGWNVNNSQSNGIMTVAPIPITAYIPLQVDEGVYDLIIDPPLLANGLWYLPDYLGPDGYPQVQLNQLQVYIYSEDQIIMANPGKNFTIEGCKTLQILPWVASSNYPFNSVNSNYPLAIQSLDISKASKVAEELGGETRYLINSYEYEQRLTGKFSVSRVNMQLFQYLLSGKLVVDNAGTVNEAEYFAPQYNDVNPYFTLVGTSNVADGNQTVILPKCKVTGNLAEMWDRTKLTVFDVTFEAHWDGTYICTTGAFGAIGERFWNANASNTPVYS